MKKDGNELRNNAMTDLEADLPIPTFGNVKKILLWLSFLAFFSVFNETVFNVSLPDIAQQYGLQPSYVNWINTSFMIAFAIGSAVYGKISDMYGVKKLLIIGLLIYSGGSLFGLLAQAYFPAVIVARAIQGAGASAVPAIFMMIVARYINAESRGRAFGMIGSMVAFGEGIGPAIGGIISHHFHWSLLFVLPMITLISLPFLIQVLPNEPSRKGKVDVLGAVLLSIGIVLFTLYSTENSWVYLLISIVVLLIFSLYIRRTKQPFIEPALFGNRMFLMGVFVGSILLGTVAGFISMVPYMMRDVYHLSTGMIGGGILFPGTISVIFFGFLGGSLVDKRGNTFVLYLGAFFIALSFLVISLFVDKSPWLTTVMLILTFGGLSFVKTVISSSVAETLASEEAGAGMGMLNLSCFLSEGIGVAIVGGLLSKHLLDFPTLPTLSVPTAFLYSNVSLVLTIFVLFGVVIYTLTYKRK
ncbi:tetracycline resistance MFS efflux pump [Brevibacillus laterosporus]|uniref:Tetracycline resistance MFS efflux pump n=2 Tax=Brevibacillus laterosporus TaxID=1465 RepID=A0AAP8QI43_BRELA|nr:MFS transporter [Brevibacillus laterosporus]PPB13146.1 tetracycline resistance MFS efflux pump [Brevibacillus laterosporus]